MEAKIFTKREVDGLKMKTETELAGPYRLLLELKKSSENSIRSRPVLPASGLPLDQARSLLTSQQDFAEQKEWLAKTVLDACKGLQFIFYPKFHCEFHFIEMYCKRYMRAKCDYTVNELCQKLPLALDSVPLVSIRKFARKCWRYRTSGLKTPISPYKLQSTL